MARIESRISPLGSIIEGGFEGAKIARDARYNQALLDIKRANELRSAEETAREKFGGFQTPTLNDKGLPIGYQINQANVDQAVKRYPDAYLNKPIPGTPAMPDPEVEKKINASTERARLAAEEEAKRNGQKFLEPTSPGAPAVQPVKPLSPQPLLKRKEESPVFSDKPVGDKSYLQGTAASNVAAGAELEIDPSKKQLIESSGGVDRYLQPVDKTVIPEGKDTTVGLTEPIPERKIIPATPAVQDPTLPTLEQMAAIDRQRFSGQKDAAKNVSLGVLPPDTRVALGFPADYTGEVPESLLIKMLDNLKQKATNDVAPEVLDAADKARKNDGAPGSLVRIAEDKLKRRLNEAERKLIFDSANRGEISDRFGQNQVQQKQKFLTSYLASSRKAMRQEIRPILEAYDAANTIFNLAGEPDSQGFRRAMQTMMAKAAGERGQLSNSDVAGSSGVEGFWEQWEQFKSSFNNQGWTDENKETFQRLASAYMNAAKQKIRGEVENQIDSDSSILANYNVAPSEVRNALSVDALLEGRSQKFDIPPKTIGRTKANPTGKKTEKVDAAAWKSYTRKAFDMLNSQKLPAEVENKKRQQILDLYKQKTGQSYFSEPK